MSSPHEFPIPVHDLDASGRGFHWPIRVSWIQSALEGTDVGPADADGALDVRASKSNTDVVVRGTLRAELTIPCARCLEPAKVVVLEEFSTLAIKGQAVRDVEDDEDDDDEDEADLSPDGADTLEYDGDTVVLDGLVRDELLLAVPMIPLCSEACPGISPSPAGDAEQAAIDPRLRPLLNLKKS
jgi:uncharacterized protein